MLLVTQESGKPFEFEYDLHSLYWSKSGGDPRILEVKLHSKDFNGGVRMVKQIQVDSTTQTAYVIDSEGRTTHTIGDSYVTPRNKLQVFILRRTLWVIAKCLNKLTRIRFKLENRVRKVETPNYILVN